MIYAVAFLFSYFLKLAKQMPPRNVNVFDVSSSFIKELMYISFGVLVGLLFIGTVGSFLYRKSGRHKQRNSLGEHLTYIVTCNSNHCKITFLLSLTTCAAEGKSLRDIFSQSYSLDAATVREGMIPATIHEDIEVARRFLRQTQEQFDRLEIKVSKFKYHQ